MISSNQPQTIRHRRRHAVESQDVLLQPSFQSAHDGAADEQEHELEDDTEAMARAAKRWKKWSYISSFKWWSDEYRWAAICIICIVALVALLIHYDGKLSPKFELDMVIIAVMTVVRVALGGIVESCLCQCAWIWVSKTHQLRAKTEARLEDFKLFDEASRGLWGSLVLLWRLKGRHLACLGALIIVVTHGFETFSQQMFVYEQKPMVDLNQTSRPAPAPYRSDYWDNVVQRGFKNDYSPALSTKAAVYSGILSSRVRDLEPHCHTANCTWPIIPTLAVCGKCAEAHVKTHCSDQTQSCTFTISPYTNVTVPQTVETDIFKVSPISDTTRHDNAKYRAYLSVFEIMTVSKRISGTRSTAAECSLWVCMKGFNISITDGRVSQNIVSIWNESRFEAATGAHSDEYAFFNVPDIMGIQPESRYSISARSLKTLRHFMDSVTYGSFEFAADVVNFSSDWIEAMWQATTNLDSWMERLSLSLTNELREHGASRERPLISYEGTASRMADYIHVQWYWMIYPPAFLLISLYYLISTILAAARDDVAVWKSDSLPMLFSRIDTRILALGPDKMNVPNGLDDLGKSKIALAKDDQGYWTFEQTHDSGIDDKQEQDSAIV